MQIGIIGGGQLAMMLVSAAHKKNIKTVVLDPNSDCSAKNNSDEFICADYNDLVALKKISSMCDIITYEFENVDLEALSVIENEKLIQTTKPLELSCSRSYEKACAKEASLNTVIYQEVFNKNDIISFIKKHGYGVVIKTDRFGYDGRGQFVIKEDTDLNDEKIDELIKNKCVVEKLVDLKKEVSVICFRNKNGDITHIPVSENEHRNNILYKSLVNGVNEFENAVKEAYKYVKYHELVGIITVEFFIDVDDNIIFNEIAPRPHNSGHYSIEGCDQSQYDLAIKALLNEKLDAVKLIDQTMMINVLGQDYDKFYERVKNNPNDHITFYDYHKTKHTINRKVGHITAVGSEAINKLNDIIK